MISHTVLGDPIFRSLWGSGFQNLAKGQQHLRSQFAQWAEKPNYLQPYERRSSTRWNFLAMKKRMNEELNVSGRPHGGLGPQTFHFSDIFTGPFYIFVNESNQFKSQPATLGASDFAFLLGQSLRFFPGVDKAQQYSIKVYVSVHGGFPKSESWVSKGPKP